MQPAVDVFIQVRRGSRRVPDKALLLLGDRSCIGHVIVRMKDVRSARHVVICTSNSEEDTILVQEADRFGVKAFQGDLNNVLDRFLQCAEHFGTEVIVRICGDSPLVSPQIVDKAVSYLIHRNSDYVRVKRLPVGTFVEVFTIMALRKAIICAVDPSRSEDLTYFVGREEINRIDEYLPDRRLRREDLVLALNRPEDLCMLRRLFEECTPKGPYLTLEEAIAFLDAHPEISHINRDYVPVKTKCNIELDPSRLKAMSECVATFKPE